MAITRRSLLGRTASVVPFAALGMPAILRAAEPIPLTYARVDGGVTGVFDDYLQAKRFDLKHGVDIRSVASYVSVTSYYADLASGTFEAGVGAWDTFYQMFLKGVPIRLASTITSGDLINLVSSPDGPQTLPELKGKTLAGIAGSGSLTMFGILLERQSGLKIGRDLKLQNVQSPATAMTTLLAGAVDAALSWEPNISNALVKDKRFRPVYNVGKEYRGMTGEPLPYFSAVIRTEAMQRNPDLAARAAAAFAECAEDIMKHPEEAFDIAAKSGKVDRAGLQAAYEGGRLVFLGRSMTDESGRRAISTAQQTLAKGDGAAALDPRFFIG